MKTLNKIKNLLQATCIGIMICPIASSAQSTFLVNEDSPMKGILSAFYQNDTLNQKHFKSDFISENHGDTYSKLIRTDKNVIEQNSIVIIDNVDGKRNKETRYDPSLRRSSENIANNPTNETDLQTLTLPNVFTPNDDGINDRFEFPCLGQIENFNILIFNRWGEMIFLSDKSCGNYWDGKYKNRDVTEGVYYYVLNAGKNLRKSGPVVVLR